MNPESSPDYRVYREPTGKTPKRFMSLSARTS
jgi:hypothetical protein